MTNPIPRILLSTKRPFDEIRRWISRAVWARWLVGFLFWELSGDLGWTPWATLSETAWDVEQEYPGARHALFAFLVGLAVHIRYKIKLEDAVRWGWAQPDLDAVLLAMVERWSGTSLATA